MLPLEEESIKSKVEQQVLKEQVQIQLPKVQVWGENYYKYFCPKLL